VRRVSTADEPKQWAVGHDGFSIGALDWGGDGPPLVLLHPNGFCAGVFDPLARALRTDYRVVGVDLRGHGTSTAPTTFEDCGFVAAATDVVAMLDHLGLDEVAILGESLGGGTGILVDRLQPGRVRALLLCEPIAMPATDGLPGRTDENPMSAMARKRRAVWPEASGFSISSAKTSYLAMVRSGQASRPSWLNLSTPPSSTNW